MQTVKGVGLHRADPRPVGTDRARDMRRKRLGPSARRSSRKRVARRRADLLDPPALRVRRLRQALPGCLSLPRRRPGSHRLHGPADLRAARPHAGGHLRDAGRGSELQQPLRREPGALQRLRRLRARGLCGRQLSNDRVALVTGDRRDLDGRAHRHDDRAPAPAALRRRRRLQRGAADGRQRRGRRGIADLLLCVVRHRRFAAGASQQFAMRLAAQKLAHEYHEIPGGDHSWHVWDEELRVFLSVLAKRPTWRSS